MKEPIIANRAFAIWNSALFTLLYLELGVHNFQRYAVSGGRAWLILFAVGLLTILSYLLSFWYPARLGQRQYGEDSAVDRYIKIEWISGTIVVGCSGALTAVLYLIGVGYDLHAVYNIIKDVAIDL